MKTQILLASFLFTLSAAPAALAQPPARPSAQPASQSAIEPPVYELTPHVKADLLREAAEDMGRPLPTYEEHRSALMPNPFSPVPVHHARRPERSKLAIEEGESMKPAPKAPALPSRNVRDAREYLLPALLEPYADITTAVPVPAASQPVTRALAPVPLSPEERQVRALERIAKALEALARGKGGGSSVGEKGEKGEKIEMMPAPKGVK